MLPSRNQRKLVARRMNELCREVGTLLLAFAPLDYFQQQQVDIPGLLGFVALGVALVVFAVIREMRGVQ